MPGLLTKRANVASAFIVAMVVLSQTATASDGTTLEDLQAGTLAISETTFERADISANDLRDIPCDAIGDVPTSAAGDFTPYCLDEQSDSASEGTERPPSPAGHNWLFVIGIDKYSQWPQLQNSVRDAKAVRDILMKHYMFDRQYVVQLYNEQATRENIIRRFEDLAKKVGVNDNVLVYYAGHGEYDQTFKRGCWIPVDASTFTTAQHLPGSDIQAFLGAIRSRSTLVISDACFSGTVFTGSMKSLALEDTRRYHVEVGKLKARQVLISGGDEPVMDESVFIDQHSIFAHYLIDRLRKNTDKYLTASSLFERIKEPVSSKSLQTPECKALQNAGDEGGEFLFVRE